MLQDVLNLHKTLVHQTILKHTVRNIILKNNQIVKKVGAGVYLFYIFIYMIFISYKGMSSWGNG